jgi:hypothetical protein
LTVRKRRAEASGHRENPNDVWTAHHETTWPSEEPQARSACSNEERDEMRVNWTLAAAIVTTSVTGAVDAQSTLLEFVLKEER